MKKNLMTVIILALVLVNLVLTAILAFTIIPQTRKSNQLIDKIASAIDLELEDGSSKDTAAVPVEDIEVYDIEASFTVNLSPSGDGKDHVAVFSIGLSLNTKSDGYKSIGTEGLKAKETLIKNDINTIVSGYTMEQFREDEQRLRWWRTMFSMMPDTLMRLPPRMRTTRSRRSRTSELTKTGLRSSILGTWRKVC